MPESPTVSVEAGELHRDLANALLRAAWSAALQETRILLLDLLVEADGSALGDLP